MPCDSGLKTGDSGGDDTAQSTPKREQKAWPPAGPNGPPKPYVLAAMQEAGPDDALFRLTDVTTLEDHEVLDVECTPYTGGPWSPDHQHGGAVAALLSFALDRMPSPGPMRLARITLDMFRGVQSLPSPELNDLVKFVLTTKQSADVVHGISHSGYGQVGRWRRFIGARCRLRQGDQSQH